MFINCKSFFSFRYGVFKTEELVQLAAERGIKTVGLTNINTTCDAWDFVFYCYRYQIKPILGVEVRNGDELLYILLAANNEGFAWINAFLSEHAINQKPFPSVLHPHFFDHPADGFVIYPLGSRRPEMLQENERIGVLFSEVNKLFTMDTGLYADKLVIRHPVTFDSKVQYNTHRLLRAIDKNILLSKLPESAQASMSETFMSAEVLAEYFQCYPFIVDNTQTLMDACCIEMDFSEEKNRKTFTGSKEDDRLLLEQLAMKGLLFRYGSDNSIARERVLNELRIINKMGFNAFFLITWDIICYARSRGFYYVGRGSGANSIIAYCLRITDVDPIELNLYFERFLNPERKSPPDFDIDFSWADRDEVINYIFKRYGYRYVALLGMYPTFQYKAALRELGKVFGLPKKEIDELQIKRKGEDNIQRLIFQYAEKLKNFPSHLSIHAGGILIAEKPIYQYAALTLPPKGFPTAQTDMFSTERFKLFKIDILSQRGLGHIRESLHIIKENRGVEVDISQVEKFKNDPEVRSRIREADTIGCFYIESPGMRQLLKKLRCDDYLTLVAASSIIRPGVAQSGMMRQYIYRYHHPDKFEYLHPIMKELLSETFGVMVFQEDVIKVAHYFAGLNLGEADILRRAMSGKYRTDNQFALIRQSFFAKCREKGHSEELSREVWRQIESFAGYSFNKAHSASFAVESFQSLFLKTYYPKEFMVAVINNFGGFYSRELYFIELRKTGANIHLPCINESGYTTCIKGNDVWVGFIHIKSLEQKWADSILAERKKHGPFLHLLDFIERTNISKEQLNILVSIGAFRFTGKSKKQLFWEASYLQSKNKQRVPASRSMFEEAAPSFTLPALHDDPLDDIYDEIALLDFPLRNPFEIVNDDPAKYVPAKDLPLYVGKNVTMLVYFIIDKITTTSTRQKMCFGTFMDAALDWVDTVHFPQVYNDFPISKGFYRLTGKVTEEFSVQTVEVLMIEPVGYKERKYRNS